MEIISGTKIGPFERGMKFEEVKSLIKEPEVHEAWMGGNLNDSIIIHGLILSFDRCNSNGPSPDSILIDYEVRNRSDATIFGDLINNWTWEKFKSYLEDNDIKYSIEYENNIDLDILLTDLELCVSFNNNVLINQNKPPVLLVDQ